MSDDDVAAREEAYLAKITARKNQNFEKKVFGGGLEAARATGGKFGGGLEAARAAATTSTTGSGKVGGAPTKFTGAGGLEAARAAAGIPPPKYSSPSSATVPTPTTTTKPTQTTTSTSVPTPTYTAPPVQSTPPSYSLPLESEVVELTMDLPLPPVAGNRQAPVEPQLSDKGLVADPGAREEARMAKLVGTSANRPSVLSGAQAPPPTQVQVPARGPPTVSSTPAPKPASVTPVPVTPVPVTPTPVQPVRQDWQKPPTQAQYGTKYENLLLAEILSARMNPQSAIDELKRRKQFYKGNEFRNNLTNQVMGTQEGVVAVDDAIDFLTKLSPTRSSIGGLVLEEGLSKSARDFCIVQKGLDKSEDDSEATERLLRYGDYFGDVLQNVAFGNLAPEELVLDWIIDDGAAAIGRPHRLAIFNQNVKCIGIASGPHMVGRVVCALFAEGYEAKHPINESTTQLPAPPSLASSSFGSNTTSSVAVPLAPLTLTEEIKYPDFVIGKSEAVDSNAANILPISHLGCKVGDLYVGLRQNGNQIEFKRTVTREGRLFNLPYQVTQSTCTATYDPNSDGGTLYIRLGKPVIPKILGVTSSTEICQYVVKGNPSSSVSKVQVQVKQDNKEFYEFVPGECSPWDTSFVVTLTDCQLVFKGTHSEPIEGSNIKTVTSTQTVNLPLSPSPQQIDTYEHSSGGLVVRVWHAPKGGQPKAPLVNQPDYDVPITVI
eukprot:TRINITY_DN2737_c0_g1_i7.p1 TRINITY_DN2737_c0_g1~~TRINITY_DN2737_c0_g1_i7.p1  ORF type:complete len:737 (+),score=142.82 TRINITY_DN2737_c0_g1_i7:59-2212(+)